jgi:hypothetical protein
MVLLPGPFDTDAAVQPKAQASSARLRANLGDWLFGATLASRDYDSDAGSNRVAGPDAQWQISGSQFVRAQWLGSQTSAAPDANGNWRRVPRSDGHFAVVEWFGRSDRSEANLKLRDIDDGFRNDSGFLAQNDLRELSGSINRKFRSGGRWHEITPFIDVLERTRRSRSQLLEREIHPGIFIGGPRGLELTAQYRPADRQRVSENGPAHRLSQWKATLAAQPSRLLSQTNLELTWGDRIDVDADRVRRGFALLASGRLRLGNRLELEPRFEQGALRRDDSGRAQTETAAQLLAVAHFSPRDTLRLIAQRSSFFSQPEAAPATRERDSLGSLVYTHRRSLATVFFAGASRSRSPADGRATNELFVKLQAGLR